MLSINKDQKRNKVIEKRLLNKKDFLIIAGRDPDLNIDNLKKMKVNELRALFKLTHSIDGNLKDMRGNCFGCLTSLRHDYTSKLNKNYCMDCL
tara:strand:+ start:218 stop:496 length:279 start_codon:yes stop_codon:yes gene_type:complete